VTEPAQALLTDHAGHTLPGMASSRWEGQRPRSAVLVHGLWSCPQDWGWVTPLLEGAGVEVRAVDLPSHTWPDAGLRADAETVRVAIGDLEPPTVVAAWSSGADSMRLGAQDQRGVARLVYVACCPEPATDEQPAPLEWIDTNPLLRRFDDGTFVLDTDLWLAAESHLFPPEVLTHLQDHRRRPVSLRALTEANPGHAWDSVPFTLLLGRSDPLVQADEATREARDLLAPLNREPDIRLLDCDHFIPFRQPHLIADVILETLP